MAEFAAASSAAGLISLGLEVTKGLVKYCQAWKSLPKDMQVLQTHLQALSQTLEALSGVVSSASVDRKSTAYSCMDDAIVRCGAGLRDLEVVWKKYNATETASSDMSKLRAGLNRALYPFQKEDVAVLNTTLNRLQANLKTASDVFLM